MTMRKLIRCDNTEGFTLVEIVTALAILAIGLLSLMALFPVGMTASRRAGDNTQAAMLAQLKMADIMYQAPGSLAVGRNPVDAAFLSFTTFGENTRYGWATVITQAVDGGGVTMTDLYHVQVAIYNAGDGGELFTLFSDVLELD